MMKKLSIELRPSRYLAAFLLLIHGGIILMFLFIRIAWWAQWIISLSMVTSFWILFRQYVTRQSQWSVLKLWLESDGGWYLRMRSGKELKANLKGDSFSSEKLLILNFLLEDSKKPVSVLIFSDASDKKTFQALRVWLNLRR